MMFLPWTPRSATDPKRIIVLLMGVIGVTEVEFGEDDLSGDSGEALTLRGGVKNNSVVWLE